MIALLTPLILTWLVPGAGACGITGTVLAADGSAPPKGTILVVEPGERSVPVKRSRFEVQLGESACGAKASVTAPDGQVVEVVLRSAGNLQLNLFLK
jgi:hypothetical protein